MKRLGLRLGLFSLLISSTAFGQQISTCRPSDLGPIIQSCNDMTHGWGGTNGPYLEGYALEALHFLAPDSSRGAFPPPAGTVLNSAPGCVKAPPPPVSIQIKSCKLGPKGSAICNVHLQSGAKICAERDPDPNWSPDQSLVAVRGYWDGTGNWIDDPRSITLACDRGEGAGADAKSAVNSAIGTCIRAGYSPEPDRRAFLTCIRAVRGDYCGDGIPHTMPGTEITLHDNKKNTMKASECADGKSYEATWWEKGALCMFHDRWNGVMMSGAAVWLTCDISSYVPAEGAACADNDPRMVISTRSACNKCQSQKVVPVCGPDQDPVCKRKGPR
jgi:ADYC domain-containing protein